MKIIMGIAAELKTATIPVLRLALSLSKGYNCLMKGTLLVGGVLVLAIVGFFVFSSSKSNDELKTVTSSTPQIQQDETRNIDIKAAFAIFTNGTFRVFTASMYHNLSPDVFIEASNPNVVHVKKAGITWDGFFKTLPMKLTRDCLTTGTGQSFCINSNQTLKFYLNGERNQNALNRTINHGDKLLVSFGNGNQDQIKNQLPKIPNINQN